MQSPVAQFALGPGGLCKPVSLRFFYLGLAALLLAAAAGLGAQPRGLRRTAAIALLAVALAGTTQAHALARQWAELGALEVRPYPLALQHALRELAPARAPCIVRVEGRPADVDVPGFLDSLAKGLLPADHPLAGCVVLGDDTTSFQLTPGAHCSDAAWAPLRPRLHDGSPLPSRATPGLCMHYFDHASVPAGGAPPTVVLHWDGTRFVALDGG